MNSQRPNLAEKLLPHEIDAAPPPSNEPVIHLPPSQAEVEDARVGQSYDSAHLGAEVTTDTMATTSPVTGGDPDADAGRAETVGEEAVGGTTPTPEQNDVDALADAVGISTQPEHPVGVLNEMNRRDDQRFELDPDSKDPES
ncbi:DUF6335 family protein [Phormidium tenue]|nr:DUF6335 family protein [Phormidium tenue]MBD2231283.1 hypothetical protein [Phormidium tenue FACHB-1052]